MVAHGGPQEAGLAFEATQHARVHRFDPVDGKYDYFALVENGKAVLAIRTWVSPQGYHLEGDVHPVRMGSEPHRQLGRTQQRRE